MKTRLLALLAFTTVSGTCFADWAVVGAASRCDPALGSFELAPVIELSERDPGEVPAQPGFTKLKLGRNVISCRLAPKTTLRSTILVLEPGNGQCMGAGYVDIRKMVIDGRRQPVVGPYTAFNHECTGEILVRVSIRREGGGFRLERCTARSWDWGTGFSGVACENEELR